MQAGTKDFIDKLICGDPTRRLGCLKGGSADVKGHSWFNNLDWKKLESKQLAAPHVPKIKSQTDDSNFDHYEDEGVRNYPQARAHVTSGARDHEHVTSPRGRAQPAAGRLPQGDVVLRPRPHPSVRSLIWQDDFPKSMFEEFADLWVGKK